MPSLIESLRGFAGGNPGKPSDVMDGTLGHTPEQPEPGQVRPRPGQPPYGASGRANFYGLPQPDELNQLLVGIRGLEAFDTMYWTDAHIRRLVLMCWAPIQAAQWGLEPHGGDQASDEDRLIAEAVWWGLTEQMTPNFVEHLATVGPVLLRAGFAPFEEMWCSCEYQHAGDGDTAASTHQLLMPRKLDLRLPRTIWRWWQDDFGELTHLGQILPNRPDAVIPMSEVVYYRLAAEGDNWSGRSLLRHAYKSWYHKDKLERIDAIGQERKAVGVPLIFAPKSASASQRERVETLFASMHLSEVAYGMLPGPNAKTAPDDLKGEAWDVEIIKFDSSSGSGIQESLKYHSDGIASSFLGDFMQLGHHQVGARATAQVQQDPFNTAIEGVVEASVKPPLQRLVDRIVRLNWPDAKGSPQLRCQLIDSASLSELSAYCAELINAGAMVADPELEDFLRERADLPPANADIRQEEEEKRRVGTETAIKQMKEPPQPAGPPGKEGPSKGERERGEAGGGKPKRRLELDAPPSPPNYRKSKLAA